MAVGYAIWSQLQGTRVTSSSGAKLLGKSEYWTSKPSFGVAIMKRLLEKLVEEKQRLRTELVQIQSMLHLIDDRILEELLMEVESTDEPIVKKAD